MDTFKTFWKNINEALEFKGGEEHLFAVNLVSEIDDQIGSINGEISKDLRKGKTESGNIQSREDWKQSANIQTTIPKENLIDVIKKLI